MASEQNGDLLLEGDAGTLDENEQKSSPIGSILSNSDILRQITLILALAICLAIAVFILLWGKEPDMRPLGTFTTEQLVKTLDYLDQQKIPYEVEGKSVLVNAEKYPEIRLQLTRAGLTSPEELGGRGEDILLNDSSFGISQRMEGERLKLSRERQLASAIEQFQSVAKAQVLLAIPKDNVFARNERKPSATVVVNLKGAALDQGTVDAIVDMVASAVHGLEPTRVTVTDQNGRLLNSGSQDPVAAQTRREFAMQQKQELEYKQKIDAILIPVLGADNYTAEVDLALDFTQQEQTRKTFNPDLPAVRSEMTMEESSANGQSMGVPGALTNQPPSNATIPEKATGEGASNSASGRSRKEATRNYELDTTVSHTRRQMGGIRRMTVSVAVDFKTATAADGKVTREPRNQAELDTLRRVLGAGLGFDVTRGDTLEVVTIPFNRPELESVAEPPLYEQPWFWRAVRIAASVLIIIVLIVTIVRPMLKRLLYPDAKPEHELDFDNHAVLGGDDELSLLAAQAESEPVFGLRDGQLKLPDLHRDEDLLKAVRALVANEPDLAAQVIKEWVTKDA
ncbi:flagellar basal-body MS-ring/collar protein FliF [Aeromonas schubertii]|uniref:Flagellar M-ring protein n=3 Tax=Aeromonas TaxID=642 RepID=A0A0S2SN70_9GAMM|nr:flagellar basal-body MS-ring/collar protein FliF [Aeromonas schubertii]ALP43183.1 flagellar MS-ring protein [Aeromonas schubertii]KUE80402.1 flagellar M-ring protein FliF [Aeromonas schubertii]MBZ6066158.1 flagellar M-ring protein FliF [Aeromonas schubertii]MBZ6071320.1 flagellar M-ring protein FliF [Aeromonas schubertii]QCG47664.1 flagellar basal body M-ring protein FliF [Aeromonas schubertii]